MEMRAGETVTGPGLPGDPLKSANQKTNLCLKPF
jgi:hypothetical protein